MKWIYIERLLKVEKPENKEKIWAFYEGVFRETDENTPISQSFPKDIFLDWLTNERVVKFFVKKEGIDEICGIGLVTNQIRLDYFFSSQYFNKHYDGAEIYQYPVIAVARDVRCLQITSMLVKALVD